MTGINKLTPFFLHLFVFLNHGIADMFIIIRELDVALLGFLQGGFRFADVLGHFAHFLIHKGSLICVSFCVLRCLSCDVFLSCVRAFLLFYALSYDVLLSSSRKLTFVGGCFFS